MGAKEKIKDWLWAVKKNRTTQGVILGILVIIIVVLAGFLVYRSDRTSVAENTNTVTPDESEPEETRTARKIDGVIAEDQQNVFPSLVMIENLSTIRDQQYGLSKANHVIEALAEGGITRFLAVYAGAPPLQKIGPVRSGRGYFLEWMEELGGVYAHAGGSPEALALIKELKRVVDLNQIGGDQAYFWREKNIEAPHNLFTSSELLARAHRDKEAPEEADYLSWSYTDEAPASKRPAETKTIRIDYSTYSYLVEYEYNAERNDYLRKNGGEIQKDALDGSEIRPKNVVVQFVKTSLLDERRLTMDVTGEGSALVFRDGEMINATWKKESRSDRTIFSDTDGQEIEFNRGTTWVEVVPTDKNVEYK